LRKLGCDFVIRGECEEAIVALAAGRTHSLGVYRLQEGELCGSAVAAPCAISALPPLTWTAEELSRPTPHHHHRFDAVPDGLGAEVEASRGCPYACTFCAKLEFREAYRRRDLSALLAEIDGLLALGVTYLYFIDEIFLPWRALLQALAVRPLRFGVQTRIDLWRPDQLDLLGAAGCVSIEAGLETLSAHGRADLGKACRLDTAELEARLLHARRSVPFVQANLMDSGHDHPEAVAAFRTRMRRQGVWANDPVPLFPYPSSPSYHRLFGTPDDEAWERAHAHYLGAITHLSDIQDSRPLPLAALETEAA